MNNNNIYFSCFSLIRACVSSLFDNFSKVVCGCLIVCFVFVSPAAAYASTTESMMMYAPVDDQYSVMPLDFSDSYNFVQYTGIYNRNDETFAFNELSLGSKSNGDFVVPDDWYGVSMTREYYSGLMPVFGFSLGTADTSSSLSVPDGSTLSIYINDVYGENYVPNVSSSSFIFSPSLAVPYRVYADMYFTATQQVDYTHSPTYHNQTVELTNFFSAAQVPYNADIAMDVNIRVPVQADQSNLNPNIDKLYNINLRYIKIYAVYDFSMFVDLYNNSTPLTDNLSYGDYMQFRWAFRNNGDTLDSSRITVTYSGGTSGTNIDTSTSAIQSSISSLTTNVSNQIRQVTNTVTQSTNTITNRIQTLETNVSTGLNNVVESAKQNTQNIINTVTQKVDEVKTGITEVKDSILDLPNKLQEMLTEFIVPDAETMGGKYSEFTELLEAKLGLIYQIPAMILELFETLVSGVTDPQTTLTFPSLSLPWIDGTQMKLWDSIEFEIIPTGMDVLKDLIQTVTSMVCVIMTFNSVKRIYENFLRGR